MNSILKDASDYDSLPENVSKWNVPDEYPCLAVGRWTYNPNGPDGYEYTFISLIQLGCAYLVDQDKL